MMDIYHVDGLPYESLMVMLLSATLGPAAEEGERGKCDQGPNTLKHDCMIVDS